MRRDTIGQVFPPIDGTSKPVTIMSVDSTDYIENFIFENGKPDKYLFNGGYYTYATPETGYTRYHYYITDHLGNNRVVINENNKVEQTVHYYPFGVVYADAGFNPNFQKHKYTAKELDLTHGLNTYDHGARQNYSILGVWDRIDPMAEKYYNISPYVVCGNNPLFIMDSKGDSLTLLGARTDINSAIEIYNKGLGGFYTVSANDNGNLSIQAVEGTDLSEMSSPQKTVFEKLKTIIDDEGNTIINVTNNSEETLIGDISKHEIDVGDMQQLKDQKELNDVSSMMHETYENYQVQVLNTEIHDAHHEASNIESHITGYMIQPFERKIKKRRLKLHVVYPSKYNMSIRIKNKNIPTKK
jgi:RHS repeat-associated protein